MYLFIFIKGFVKKFRNSLSSSSVYNHGFISDQENWEAACEEHQTSAVTDSCNLCQIALNSLNEYSVDFSRDLDGCGVILRRKYPDCYSCELQLNVTMWLKM